MLIILLLDLLIPKYLIFTNVISIYSAHVSPLRFPCSIIALQIFISTVVFSIGTSIFGVCIVGYIIFYYVLSFNIILTKCLPT